MSPHQFPATHDALIVSLAAWEIECCAPPPVVGEPTEWRLQFNLIDEPAKYWLPSAVTNLTWSVEPWPDPDSPHRMLTRGGIIALLAAGDGGRSSRTRADTSCAARFPGRATVVEMRTASP